MTKTVLITGSNRGIGLAFAQHYVKQGWNVVATARNVDAAEELKRLQPWKIITLDTGDEQSISSAAKALEGVALALLINNSGISIGGGLDVTTKEDMMRQFEVNTVGPFLVTRAFLPNLRLAVAAHGDAFVAQITSRMGSIADNGSGGSYGYRASKTALNMVTQSLALDLKSEKIGCLLLHPGYVNTAIVNFTGIVSPEDSVAGMVAHPRARQGGRQAADVPLREGRRAAVVDLQPCRWRGCAGPALLDSELQVGQAV